MSQAQVSVDPQTVAAGLLPLLKEYTQRLQEVSANSRRIQRRYAKLRFGTQEATRKRGMGLNVGSPGAKQPASIQDARADFEDLRFTFNRLVPSTTDLSRQASQLVEHGKLEPVTRIELSLRLADFESALRQAQQRIGQGLPG